MALLSALLAVSGYAYIASYAPGIAPWHLPETAARRALVAADAGPAPGAAPTSDPVAVGVGTDGDDTLVLVGPGITTAAGAVVVRFESSTQTLALRPEQGSAWTVSVGGRRPFVTLAATDRGIHVIRVLNRPPSARWSATVSGIRIPPTGSATVTEFRRLRGSWPRDPLPLTVIALLAALVVAPRAYRSAGYRLLRVAVTSVLFGLITVAAAPSLVALVGRLVPAPGAVPIFTASVVALVTVGVAWTLAAGMTPQPETDREVTQGLRFATALVALAQVAVLTYVAEGAAARLLPGLP